MKETEVFCIDQRYSFEVTYDTMASHDIVDEVRSYYCDYCYSNYEDEDGEVSDDYDPASKKQFNEFIKYLKDTHLKVKVLDKWVSGTNVEWT